MQIKCDLNSPKIEKSFILGQNPREESEYVSENPFCELLQVVIRYIWVTQKCTSAENFQFPRWMIHKNQNAGDVFSRMGTGKYLSVYDLAIIEMARNSELPAVVASANGWEDISSPPNRIAALLSGVSPTKVFINPSSQTTIVCVKKLTARWTHLLALSMTDAFPYLYKLTNAEKRYYQRSDDDIELANAISNYDWDKVIEICNKVVAERGMKEYAEDIEYRKAFDNIAKSPENTSRAALARIEEELSRMESDYAAKLKQYSDERQRYESLIGLSHDGYREFRNSFSDNVILSGETVWNSVSGYKIVIKTAIKWWEDSVLKSSFDRPNSSLNGLFEWERDVIKAIFLDKRAELMVYGCFHLSSGGLTPMRGQRESDVESEYMPHCHIVEYGCPGDGNRREIARQVSKGYLDQAIEIALTAAENVNFADNVVMPRFFSMIMDYRNGPKCVWLPDGRKMTISEFSTMIEDEKYAEIEETPVADFDPLATLMEEMGTHMGETMAHDNAADAEDLFEELHRGE